MLMLHLPNTGLCLLRVKLCVKHSGMGWEGVKNLKFAWRNESCLSALFLLFSYFWPPPKKKNSGQVSLPSPSCPTFLLSSSRDCVKKGPFINYVTYFWQIIDPPSIMLYYHIYLPPFAERYLKSQPSAPNLPPSVISNFRRWCRNPDFHYVVRFERSNCLSLIIYE